MTRSKALLWAVPTGIALLIGCAEGSEVDPNGETLATEPEESGEGDGEGTALPPASNPSTSSGGAVDAGKDSGKKGSTSSTSSSSSSTSSSSSSSGGSSTSSSTSSSSGGSSSTTPTVVGTTCTNSTTCSTSTATNLGQVAGDSGSQVKTVQGVASQWLKILVTEEAVFGDLSLKATLTSPPGSNFDLFMHYKKCDAPDGKSESTSSSDTATVGWRPSNPGAPDDKTVLIEVRQVSGTCDPAAKWTLKLEGNK